MLFAEQMFSEKKSPSSQYSISTGGTHAHRGSQMIEWSEHRRGSIICINAGGYLPPLFFPNFKWHSRWSISYRFAFNLEVPSAQKLTSDRLPSHDWLISSWVDSSLWYVPGHCRYIPHVS